MPDSDDRLAAELREYYRQLAQQPAPDVTDRVLIATEARRARRWAAIGGGVLGAAAAAAVLVLALVNHSAPTESGPAHTPTPLPVVSATPTLAPPSVLPAAVGPPAVGLVPTDVTAISASEWWILGYDAAGCSGASCTRILHTLDAGHTFSSLPPPLVSPPQGGRHAHMRFGDTQDGWVYDGTASVWTTHDGGHSWNAVSLGGSVSDIEASNGSAYAIVCTQAPDCSLWSTSAADDSWAALSVPSGVGKMALLSVQGNELWAAVLPGGQHGGNLLASSDAGHSFSFEPACSPDLGVGSVDAVSATVLWLVCPTGTEATASLSTDGGRHFTSVPIRPLPNFASIAGISSTTAVVGAQFLLRTTDGGQTSISVEDNQSQWTIVGFTTPVNGFAFDLLNGAESLWRTDDAGAHWHQLHFP